LLSVRGLFAERLAGVQRSGTEEVAIGWVTDKPAGTGPI
jgi:hypothetical protein